MTPSDAYDGPERRTVNPELTNHKIDTLTGTVERGFERLGERIDRMDTWRTDQEVKQAITDRVANEALRDTTQLRHTVEQLAAQMNQFISQIAGPIESQVSALRTELTEVKQTAEQAGDSASSASSQFLMRLVLILLAALLVFMGLDAAGVISAGAPA